MSALPSSSAPACSLSASRTVPLPSIVFLMPSPWATSWNITLAKNASNLMRGRWSAAISSPAIGSRMRSNLARMAFLSWSRRVPFWSCTCSSFGRLMAIVLEPAFACPA